MRRSCCGQTVEAEQFVVELVGIVFEHHARESVHSAKRGAQVMGDGITEGLQLLVGGEQLGGAVLKIGIELADFLLGAPALHLGLLALLLGFTLLFGLFVDFLFDLVLDAADEHVLFSLNLGLLALFEQPVLDVLLKQSF